MWIVGLVSRATGLGSVVSLLIVLASSAAVLTGTYVFWKRSVIAERDQYWESRMLAEKKRVENIIAEEGKKSAERITAMLKKQVELQEKIDADEEAVRIDPNRDLDGLGLDGVRRIDSIH